MRHYTKSRSDPPGNSAASRFLRGGRLTKWKGRVASYAPFLAQLIPATTRKWAARLLAATLVMGAFAGTAMSATLYWDPNGALTGRGGSGTWNTSSLFWDPNSGGVCAGPCQVWDNIALNDAVFGDAATGTVALGVPITVHNMTFESGVTAYTFNGSTLTLGGVTPTVNIVSGTVTINSIVAGTAGLNKIGAGVLLLTNTANSFSGGIAGSGGTLQFNGDSALGAASNNISLTGGGLNLTNTGTTDISSARTVTIASGAVAVLRNASTGNVGAAKFTGAGNVSALNTVTMSNDANDYTGTTTLSGSGIIRFTSIANLGVASSLGAPISAANGLITVNTGGGSSTTASYIGDGDSSNRNWQLNTVAQGGAIVIANNGSGTLTLTGNIGTSGGQNVSFAANLADLQLLGVISGSRTFSFGGGAGRTITLGGANTYVGGSNITTVTVKAGTLADTGTVSSFGTSGTIAINGGTLSYTGGAASSNRAFTLANASSIRNDGTGSLTLSGSLSLSSGSLTLGGSFAGVSTISGVISGAGGVVAGSTTNPSDPANVWVLSGINTYVGTTRVENGTLRAGGAQAFGAANPMVVNGGTLDLNANDITVASLAGTGGTIALGANTLTVKGASSPGAYAGTIAGTGGLTKLGTGTLTLTGANSYTGATNIGGGTLALNFAAASAPATDIIAAGSTLNMSGGTLAAIGADNEDNVQNFNGLNVVAGSSKVNAIAGAVAGDSMTIDLGAINRTGGLVDFGIAAGGVIHTDNAQGFLGGWATVTVSNVTNYAEVDASGNIVAFTDYDDKDDAGTWADGDVVSDDDGDAQTFSGTVVAAGDTDADGKVELGGLQYTVNANSSVSIGAGQILSIDGAILVSSQVGSSTKVISGPGALTGGPNGGTLGILHNGTGNFTISAQIIDNGGATSFVKGGAGTVTLSNNTSNYTGATTLSSGTLSVSSIGNGGAASAIGASGAASSNLVLESGTLIYTGGTTATDRGFTLVNGGPSRVIQISGAANLTFDGAVVSADGAGFTKTGTGTLTLANNANTYGGVTRIESGILSVDTLANGGLDSGIGNSGPESANLVLATIGVGSTTGTLQYTGGTVTSDRGFTLESGAGGIDVSQLATTLTLSGAAVGSGSLVKSGAGILVLSGTNIYTGGTTVSAGTLRAGSTRAFGGTDANGTGAGVMNVAGGATLDLASFNNTVGGLIGGGTVTLGAATLRINNNGNAFSGTISGTGGVTIAAGTQVMTGCNNTYTGVTTLSSATLSTDCLKNGGVASGIGASGAASANLVLSNGALIYTGASETIDRGFTISAGTGAINVNQLATTLQIGGAVVGPGQLVKQGAGTLVLTGTNTYSGLTTIQEGILRAGSTSAIGLNGVRFSNVAGAGLDLNGFNTTVAYLDDGGALGGNITLGGATLTISSGADDPAFAYAGAISGLGNLIKNGDQTQRLTGCNSSYSGSTTVNGTLATSILEVSCLANGGANSSIGASSAAAANLVLNGGTLKYVGTGASTDRLFTLGASATSAVDASGTGALHFTNTGAIAFTSPNTAQTVTLTGGSAVSLENTFALQITNNGTGATGFTKTGSNFWTLENQNSSYTGVTRITGGVLGVDKLADGGLNSSIGASLGIAANLVIGNGATLRYTGTGDTTNRLFTLETGTTSIESSGTGAIVFSNTGDVVLTTINVARTISLGGTNTGLNIMGGRITNAGTGVTTLVKNGAGTWVLTGNNTFTGNTTINGGNLIVGDPSVNGGTTGNVGSGNVIVNSATSTLSFNRSDTFNLTGTISGPGTIAQIGAGTTVLTSLTNAIGATTISAGTLQVNGGLTTPTIAMTGTSALTVNGTVGGPGGTTATMTGDAGASTININGGGTLRANGNLGGGSDVVNLTGTLATGAAVLNLGDGNDTLVLNDGGTFSGAGVSAGTGTGDVLQVNNAVARTLDGAGVSGFESLNKTLGGLLTLTGDHSYTAGTTIAAGELRIGAGGTSGSLTGDVLNNALLSFNRSDSLTYAGLISGTGGVNQIGTGITILTGNSTYSGPTNVTAGTLLINGNQSGATGLTSVSSGATLGGAGTIGGNVIIANGGLIAPGSGSGNGAGTLTINGSLVLNQTSALNFQFGQANVAGGSLNDQLVVNGALTLDGQLNVTQTPGGTFGPGVYRIISYNDGFIDHGLTSNTPGFFVQTSIAGQVNLVNSAGLTLNYWDGDAGPKNNGVINGGNGTWRSAVTDNWTTDTGTPNAPWTDSAFAVFAGTAGAVTVDDIDGTVNASGLQFLTSGYVLSGDPINLVTSVATPGQAFIRVGDGTAASAGYVATINSTLSGSVQLVKDDFGTLVLTGTNTYTGGTSILNGTLQVAQDANLGVGGTLSFSGGTLRNTASFSSSRAVALNAGGGTFATVADLTLSGQITGPGALTKTGTAALILTNDNTYLGATTISQGTLQLGVGGTTGSITGNVLDNGTLAFNRSDAYTFAGAITGTGSVQQIGAGTTILTATNTYSGGTTISAGTLQIGNGGTSGSITGAVLNNGTLAFDRSDSYAFTGLISGTGGVNQIGTGTTILSGNNSYGGPTNVNSGTLIINGIQTGTGLTSVASGATLGGGGSIGGDVTVAGGGAINPGDPGNDAGALSIGGNLTLADTSTLNFNFGQADNPGGALNDVINVAGNLTLDGTLNVSTTPGGSFGPGLYRVINYSGTLNDQGLNLGTMPPSSVVSLQVNVPNQINLINSAGLTLTFWDGPGNPNDDVIQGGTGIWQNVPGNQNWTDAGGSVNAPWTEAEFAIFMGSPGTVTIVGPVSANGMQFAVDGYVIAGDPLTLVSAPTTTSSIIRVGDGSAAGAGMTATINSALTGNTTLVKDDLGTLVLNGTNTYTGGTRIDGGTLQIQADANLGLAAGGLTFDGGTLRNTAVINTARAVTLEDEGGTFETVAGLTLTGVVGGAGALTKTGAQTLTLSGTNIYEGGTFINQGIVSVSANENLGAATGAVTFNGGTLQNTASFTSARTATINAAGGTFQTDADLTWTGVIGGAGALTKTGTEALILTAANTYSGGTTISAGTLQLGDGGSTGSITGNVVDNGTLAFDRDNTYSFAGTISGTGGVEQIGTGITVLTADNTYDGPTRVAEGTLIINGDQTDADGDTTVEDGGILGGNGTVGGNVFVQSGGTLAPGDVGNVPGTLSIDGNLSLADGAILDYNFGEAGVEGGPFNDLTQVDGDLVLDGAINVTLAPGGAFGPGIYRVISYTGDLTDNTLEINTIPSPGFVVQTSIDGQVNLVNLPDPVLRTFWDVTPKDDDAVNGGTGTWQTAGALDNWTDVTGATNGAWDNGNFAIFAGTAGTVTVDNGNGSVQASGMQFATDGYLITGDTLTLVGDPNSIIRVGDGTADGAGYTATIDAVLAGDTQLVKTDLGTLVLGGSNTYTGGTRFEGGTVQVSANANLGDTDGDLTFAGGTLHTTASFATGTARQVILEGDGTIITDPSTTLTLDGSISGPGGWTKDGAGTVLQNGIATNGGPTTVAAGTLQAGAANVFSQSSAYLVQADGILDLAGHDQSIANLGNAGDVQLNGAPGTTLTVLANYTGANGALHINTTLGDDASLTDRLVVQGDTSGTTALFVNNIGGGGAPTTEGIKVVDVGGTSGGTFNLNGDYVFQGQQAVIGGAYAYTLQKNGVSTPQDGDWYLRSSLIDGPGEPGGPIFAPTVPIYEAYGAILQDFNELETLQRRIGNRSWLGDNGGGDTQSEGLGTGKADRLGIWARIQAGHAHIEPESSTTVDDYDVTTWKIHAGADVLVEENDAGSLVGGLSLHFGTASADISSFFGDGDIDVTGYGIAGTLTWYGVGGFYADAQAQATIFESDLKSAEVGDLEENNDGFGYALSLETGQKLPVSSAWSVTPQAQLIYSSVSYDDFTDPFDAEVSLEDEDSLIGRLGLSLDYVNEWQGEAGGTNRGHVYGISSLYYDFLDGTQTDVSGTSFSLENEPLWGSAGLGGTISWDDDKYALYGEALAKTSLEAFGDSYSVGGTAGFRVNW